MKKKKNFLEKKYNLRQNKVNLDGDLETENKKILEKAIKNHQEGKFTEAKELYEKYLNHEPNNPICKSNLGNIYIIYKELAKAEELFKQVIEENQNFSFSYINYSKLLIDQRRYNEALKIANMGLEIDKQSSHLKYNLCLSLYLLEEYKKTLKKIEIFYEDDATSIDISILGANCLFKIKGSTIQNEKIILDLLLKIKNNDNLIKTLITRSKLLGNPYLPIKLLKILIKENPEKLNYLSFIFLLLAEQNEFSDIEKILQSYDLDNIKNIDFFINLGASYQIKGDLTSAINFTKKALEIDSSSSTALMNLGALYKESGFLDMAEEYTLKSLALEPSNSTCILNLSGIYQDLQKTEKALEYVKKYLSINPQSSKALLNEANIYQSQGKLKSAEDSLKRCLKINPNEFRAYFLLSIQKSSQKDPNIQNQILSINSDLITSNIDKVDILFAQSNILHSNQRYSKSASYLKKANDIKKIIYKTDKEIYINTANILMEEEKSKQNITFTKFKKLENIFIVGMPRCGSTLLESILCTNPKVNGLGETFNVEKYFNQKKITPNLEFSNFMPTNKSINEIKVDKQLYNYSFSGFIVRNIERSKIIHLIRHPLDNILSIYKAHFLSSNKYSSSIKDCFEVYLSHLKAMTYFKELYPQDILTISYKEIVSSPEKSIKDLICKLNLEWNNSYLEHEKNERVVHTASRVQVRSPINSQSLNSWENYKELFTEDLLSDENYISIMEILNSQKVLL